MVFEHADTQSAPATNHAKPKRREHIASDQFSALFEKVDLLLFVGLPLLLVRTKTGYFSPMSDGNITYDKRGAIGVIGFDRPDKRNAFTITMFQKLAEAFTEADDDDEVRAIVVHGEGTDTTTGLDLMNVAPVFRSGEVPVPEEMVDPWHVIGRLRKTPMLTAAHGS